MAGYSKGTTLTAGEVKIKNKSDLENLGLTLDEAFAIRNDLRYRYVAIPYESTTSYTAPGDSGGPMYCELDGINKVLGIASSMSTPDNFLPWMLWSIPIENAIKKLNGDLK